MLLTWILLRASYQVLSCICFILFPNPSPSLSSDGFLYNITLSWHLKFKFTIPVSEVGESGEIALDLSLTGPAGISLVVRGDNHSRPGQWLCKSKEAQQRMGAVGKLQDFCCQMNTLDTFAYGMSTVFENLSPIDVTTCPASVTLMGLGGGEAA